VKPVADVKSLLEESPLAYRVLKLLESEDATLTQILDRLGKTKSSVSRVLQVLKREKLIEGRENPKDGRSIIYRVPKNKRTPVRTLLNKVAQSEVEPKLTRAIPFAMIDLENLVIETLKKNLDGWSITAGHGKGLDVLIQRPDPPLEIGLELRVGGEPFERHFYEFIGQIVATTELPKLVLIAVFGRVKDQVKSLTEDKLRTLLQPQGTTSQVLWLDQGPMTVDRAYLASKLIPKIHQIAPEQSNQK
jgi:DNA-binding MarR family transcriptional regulator